VSVVERLIQLCPGGDPQPRVAVDVCGGDVYERLVDPAGIMPLSSSDQVGCCVEEDVQRDAVTESNTDPVLVPADRRLLDRGDLGAVGSRLLAADEWSPSRDHPGGLPKTISRSV